MGHSFPTKQVLGTWDTPETFTMTLRDTFGTQNHNSGVIFEKGDIAYRSYKKIELHKKRATNKNEYQNRSVALNPEISSRPWSAEIKKKKP